MDILAASSDSVSSKLESSEDWFSTSSKNLFTISDLAEPGALLNFDSSESVYKGDSISTIFVSSFF